MFFSFEIIVELCILNATYCFLLMQGLVLNVMTLWLIKFIWRSKFERVIRIQAYGREQTWWMSPIKCDKNKRASVKLSAMSNRSCLSYSYHRTMFSENRMQLVTRNLPYISVPKWEAHNMTAVWNSCRLPQQHIYLSFWQNHGSHLQQSELFRLLCV